MVFVVNDKSTSVGFTPRAIARVIATATTITIATAVAVARLATVGIGPVATVLVLPGVLASDNDFAVGI